jgi:hypothetical protein
MKIEYYVANKEYLKTVGKFSKCGDFEFKNEETLEKELSKFTESEIKEAYLEQFNPVLHFALDKNDPDFIKIAFESLINWHYCL